MAWTVSDISKKTRQWMLLEHLAWIYNDWIQQLEVRGKCSKKPSLIPVCIHFVRQAVPTGFSFCLPLFIFTEIFRTCWNRETNMELVTNSNTSIIGTEYRKLKILTSLNKKHWEWNTILKTHCPSDWWLIIRLCTHRGLLWSPSQPSLGSSRNASLLVSWRP